MEVMGLLFSMLDSALMRYGEGIRTRIIIGEGCRKVQSELMNACVRQSVERTCSDWM